MKRLLSVLVLVVLVVSPVAVFAQTEEPAEWQQYTSEDGTLTASYPPGWIAENGGEEIPFPSVVVVNSEDTLAAWNDPASMGAGPGQIAILTLVIPKEFFAAIGFPLPEGASIAELTGELAGFFATPDEGDMAEPGMAGTEAAPQPMATEEMMAEPSATEEAGMEGMPGVTLGEAQEMDLGGGVMGGYVDLTDATGQGAIVVRDLGGELLSATIATAAPGEFSEEYAAIARQIAASVAFTGTAEDLMGAMMSPEVTVAPGEATLSGEELLQERCTVCHDLERVDSQDKDEAGWTATVDRMISYGAQLNAGERETLIQYLVETH